jgi:uncharacterized protein (DUF488 family)
MLQIQIARIKTIGYEGVTLERFLACLEANDVEMIIDVRANPISRKPGFSKTALHTRLAESGISYRHFRELGIPSSIRRQYDNIDELLDYYDEFILPQPACQEAARVVAGLCREHNAALLCFEANWQKCHRSRLAQHIGLNNAMT